MAEYSSKVLKEAGGEHESVISFAVCCGTRFWETRVVLVTSVLVFIQVKPRFRFSKHVTDGQSGGGIVQFYRTQIGYLRIHHSSKTSFTALISSTTRRQPDGKDILFF